MPDLHARTLQAESFLRRAPRQARSAERLERLLAATREILVTDGYPGVTVAALKSHTGMPHSTIYDVVADPRDLVAMLMVRTLDELHAMVNAAGAQVVGAQAAVDFARRSALGFIAIYRNDALLRAGLSGLDADPAYRWICLADSARNARVVADVIGRHTGLPLDVVYERCLLITHLVQAAASMAVDLGDDGDSVVRAFAYVIESAVPDDFGVARPVTVTNDAALR
jgi:AcrR family transcriptional regulator